MIAKESNIIWGEFLYLAQDSPSGLRWRKLPSKFTSAVKVDDVAGYCSSDGYWKIVVNKTSYCAHRIVYEMVYCVRLKPTDLIDHLDGNKSNNCISNLTISDDFKNAQNKQKHKNNTSGITGVYRREYQNSNWNSWVAQYYNKGKLRTKAFNIGRLGEDAAFKAACSFREQIIQKLNAEGESYTDRHGV